MCIQWIGEVIYLGGLLNNIAGLRHNQPIDSYTSHREPAMEADKSDARSRYSDPPLCLTLLYSSSRYLGYIYGSVYNAEYQRQVYTIVQLYKSAC